VKLKKLKPAKQTNCCATIFHQQILKTDQSFYLRKSRSNWMGLGKDTSTGEKWGWKWREEMSGYVKCKNSRTKVGVQGDKICGNLGLLPFLWNIQKYFLGVVGINSRSCTSINEYQMGEWKCLGRGSILEKLLVKFGLELYSLSKIYKFMFCQRFINPYFPYIKAMSFHLIAMSHKG